MPNFWKYPDEVSDYIREHVTGTTSRDLTTQLNEQFSEKYGITFTESCIKSYKSNHKLKSGTLGGLAPGYSPKYPEGMLDFVRSIAKGKSTQELVDAVNEKYGSGTICARQMMSYKKNHRINTGLTGYFKPGHVPDNKGKTWDEYMSPEGQARSRTTTFKKGNVPANRIEVGEYTHTTDGYLLRKVKESGTQSERFEFVHRAVWEEHNGPIPDGKMVSFLDGDKDNCSIDNLVLIDNATNLEMNRRGYRFKEAELTSVGVEIAKLSIATKKAKQRRKEARKNEKD